MTARRALPPALAELPFSRRAARAAGILDGRLSASDLVRPFHAVRATSALPADVRWLCRAYQERMDPAHTFSHQTAAELYGLPLPIYAASRELHISVQTPLRAPEAAGVTGHRVAPGRWQTREIILRDEVTGDLFAFRVVSPDLLWAQLAATLDPDDLVALGDAIVTSLPRPGLRDMAVMGSINDLRVTAASHSGRRGAKAMSAAVGRIRSGPLSRPESLLRLMMLRAGFPEPQLNVEVTDRRGIGVATPDFSWPQSRVVVEYEGDLHRTSKAKFRSDVTRGERYADAGWFQLRAHAEDAFGDPNPFLGRLRRRMVVRGWRPAREMRQISGARR